MPNLRAAAERAAVVMIGGIAKAEKLERVRARTCVDTEWLATADASGAAGNLARRVRDGRGVGVVMVQSLIGHSDYGLVVAAARSTSVPVVYADRAGKGALARALVELDARLGVDRKTSAA